MCNENRKVVLVGTGLVGMSFAYAALNQRACDELVLIDINKQRAEGEAMDLNHGLAFSSSNMKIYAGDYKDCADADIVVICAGVAQRPGESRLDLLQRNTAVFRSIVGPVTASGFSGVFLIATNPVDIMAYVTYKLSGFPKGRVLGTGTTLDTARLRYLLGDYFRVDPRNVHAYVVGEHGDSEFVPWSQALVATKPVMDLCRENHGKDYEVGMKRISEEVKSAAQRIIAAKKATYYGIGMSLVRIVRAILGDEHSVFTVSAYLEGEYGVSDIYAGLPSIVCRQGVDHVIRLNLLPEEQKEFQASCGILKKAVDGIRFD